MQIEFAALTHPGRVRKNNEDAYLLSALDGEEPILNEPERGLEVGPAGFLAAVADGMGGAAAGEIASREGLAAMNLHLFLHWARFAATDSPERRLVHVLIGAVKTASQAVLRYADDDRSSRGMGSTLTTVLLWRRSAYIAQVGDSRAYLLRRGELHQITVDQTLVHDMVESGAITAEEARTHPQRNMITQALGSPQPLRVPVWRADLKRGDKLLVCSDGLHGEVEDEKIREILSLDLPPHRSLELLVEAAIAHGGRDNITGVLLNLEDPMLPLALPADPLDIERLQDTFQDITGEVKVVGKLKRLFGGGE
ncbi:MAG TPA: protein phosphatase 2C domain-containing protein [Holophagaceae bacterium]|nr:protein phosphatase 2C domain-containing protein [Holophagaceae bacterium]